MPKPIHAELKAVLVKHGDNIQDLAAELGVDRCLFGRKLNGRDPWESWEMFAIMKHYDLPHDQTHIYFPFIEPEQLLARRRAERDKGRARKRVALPANSLRKEAL